MAEPITLPDARLQLRLKTSTEDVLVEGLITAAREWVENFTGLKLVPGEVVDTFSRFGPIELSAWPIRGTPVVTYLDGSGAGTTLATFRMLQSRRPARLVPAIGSAWPSSYPCGDAVSITYQAGYASPDDVPQALKLAMLLLLVPFYERRAITPEETAAVEGLCRPYRLPVMG